MDNYSFRSSAFALVAVLAPSAAFADVTAADVWDSWKSLSGTVGQTLNVGSETMADGTLTLRDVTMKMAIPDGEGTIESAIAEVTLRETGSGKVEITMSPSYDLVMALTPADDPAMDIAVTIATPGMGNLASGDPDAISYDLTAPEITLTLSKLIVGGQPVEISTVVALGDVIGNYRTTVGEGGRMDYDISAKTLTMDMTMVSPETPANTLAITAAYDDIAMTSSGDMQTMGDPDALFSGKMDMAGTFRHAGGTMTVDVVDPENGTLTFASKTDAGTLDFKGEGAVLSYEGGSDGVEISVSGDAIPFPELTATLDRLAFGVTMPIAQTDRPQDFALLLNLSGLTVSDALWAMADPAAVLPRDPATLLIDLVGKAKLLVDLGDPEQMTGADAPGELNALTIKRLNLNFAGADLSGSGDFTFDNSDLTTFDGMPAPEGTAELKLVGGNTLIDKLVEMGLLPGDQAMWARMMLGGLAKPSGEDTLTSTIEFGADGSVTANGQELQ